MRILAFIGALAIIVAVAAGAYLFGGYYDIAASAGNPGFVDAAIVAVRRASIDRHATDAPPAGLSLTDAAVVQDGARAFAARGCTNCHGGPGVPWAKFSEGLNPGPPDLKDVAPHLEPRQLFWIIKNGINMTGMPGFGAIEMPDREVWTIVAFLKQLPGVSGEEYKAWTATAKQP